MVQAYIQLVDLVPMISHLLWVFVLDVKDLTKKYLHTRSKCSRT